LVYNKAADRRDKLNLITFSLKNANQLGINHIYAGKAMELMIMNSFFRKYKQKLRKFDIFHILKTINGKLDTLLSNFAAIELKPENPREGEVGVVLPNPCSDKYIDITVSNNRNSQAIRAQIRIFLDSQDNYCLQLPDKNKNHLQPLFHCSQPKAGTHLVNEILSLLGYWYSRDINGFGEDWVLPITGQTQYEAMFHSLFVKIPYDYMLDLLRPGQFLIGHSAASCFTGVPQEKTILYSIRDLRYATISNARYMVKIAANAMNYPDPTENLLMRWFAPESVKGSYMNTKDGYYDFVARQIPLLNRAHVVRFEDITSPDSFMQSPSLQAIAKATGCDSNMVKTALGQALRVKTMTYTGKLSTLNGVWTEQVEAKFKELGGDVLNERLGYPREFTPESYPECRQ
jgi:hypothetical protein